MASPFTFEVIPAEYSDFDAKLTIRFDYNERYVQAMRLLKGDMDVAHDLKQRIDDPHNIWQRTHAGFHDPTNEQYSSPLDENRVDYQCWHIDHTTEALSLFESVTDTVVPANFWPTDFPTTESTDVELTIPPGDPCIQITGLTDRLNRLLDDAFSYEVPDAKYHDAYQSGDWDGREHLYDATAREAPIGLLDRIIETLESEGASVTVDNQHPNKGSTIQTSWQFDHDLRDYQREAVNAALTQSNGILSLPTGTGKTATALRILHTLSKRSLILVHTKELLYQWADRIEATLGITPGLIGDDQWSEGDITVAIMQTLLSRGTDALDTDYGVLVFDECHRTSAADTMHAVGTNIDAFYRFGLSATPWRRIDGQELRIEGAVGQLIHRVTAPEMIEQGYLANPTFETIDPELYGDSRTAPPEMDYHEAVVG